MHYNFVERDDRMKNIFLNLGKKSKRIIISGWSLSIILLISSAVVFFGAGKIFDYYPSMALCNALLSASRPVFVISSIASLGVEYFRKQKER